MNSNGLLMASGLLALSRLSDCLNAPFSLVLYVYFVLYCIILRSIDFALMNWHNDKNPSPSGDSHVLNRANNPKHRDPVISNDNVRKVRSSQGQGAEEQEHESTSRSAVSAVYKWLSEIFIFRMFNWYDHFTSAPVVASLIFKDHRRDRCREIARCNQLDDLK